MRSRALSAIGPTTAIRPPSAASGSTPSFSSSTIDRRTSSAASVRSSASSWSSAATDGASTYGRSNRPEPELEPQDALDREVDDAAVDPPVRDRRAERLAEPGGRRQLAVEPGPDGHRRGRAQVGGQAMLADQHLDRRVVGGDDAVEAPLVAQDRRQQLARRVARQRRRRRSRPASSHASPASRTAASNGTSCSSRSSRGPAWAGRLVQARPRPARGPPGACRSRRRRSRASSPCMPRTYATPSAVAR